MVSIQPVSSRQPDIASCNFLPLPIRSRSREIAMTDTAEHFDVLIVGAGLSGIGAGYHLQQKCPGKSYVILEGRDCIGGTWDLFRYPGIRSDSDMYTLGYSFRPWAGAKAIADGDSIREYIEATVADEGLESRIRLNYRVVSAEWSSETARWTVTAVPTSGGEYRQDDAASRPGEAATFTCSFLSVCSGYYRYDEGFTPAIEGADTFAGSIVHPQHWPADLDYEGKQVVVIGSGATAVTLVPSMAKSAAKVTMLQRSPTYIAPVPSRDHLADRLRGKLPAQLAYDVVRVKNILFSMFTYQLSRRRPETMKAILRKSAVAKLPQGFAVDTHLAPSYQPWDQRVCAIPNGDLYRAISAGTADIVTDRISRITRDGIESAGDWRDDAHRRRRARGRGQGPDLQGHDARRRAQLCAHHRVHQCIVDPEGGSGRRLRLPAAEAP